MSDIKSPGCRWERALRIEPAQNAQFKESFISILEMHGIFFFEEERTMQCLWCRYLRWSLSREKPDWVAEADRFDAELSSKGTNSDALALADRDPARLREVYELWNSRPADAFNQFLSLVEHDSSRLCL